jgi:L-ascorbate 6-phosphate lactonase
MNMGHQAPGATDKMSPYDAMRVAQAVRTKVLLPNHYDNWASSQEDPSVLEWLVQKEAPDLKTVILQPGARFVYPDDREIGRYKYPDYAELYRPDFSWEYGAPSRAGSPS